MFGRTRQNIKFEGKLSFELANELFVYSPDSGEISCKKSTGQKTYPGKILGTTCKTNGYTTIRVGRRRVQAHIIAWLLMTGSYPTSKLDHINRIRNDNRWENLRLTGNDSNNVYNTGLSKHNTSGYKGVSKKRDKWKASIAVKRKTIHLGTYRTPEEAAVAYNEAAMKYFGEFAYLNEINLNDNERTTE